MHSSYTGRRKRGFGHWFDKTLWYATFSPLHSMMMNDLNYSGWSIWNHASTFFFLSSPINFHAVFFNTGDFLLLRSNHFIWPLGFKDFATKRVDRWLKDVLSSEKYVRFHKTMITSALFDFTWPIFKILSSCDVKSSLNQLLLHHWLLNIWFLMMIS